MNFLFIADPLDSFKTYKDSTFAMMSQAQANGHQVFACEVNTLHWKKGQKVSAKVLSIELTPQANYWYHITGDREGELRALADFDAVLMRKDPPFDSEFFYATHLLSQASREGAKVFNQPQALREHPEKLAILEFPDFITPTLVTRNPQDIKDFHGLHQDIILKPLDGMGGTGIFRVPANALNLGAIIETLNCYGEQTVMVQKFIPQIKEGDKRVLLIGGEVVPYCLARIPQGTEVRGNLAAGGKGVAQELSPRDRKIAETLAPVLLKRGLMLVGLDIIGDCLTEINVTSPTGFQEITQQKGFNVAEMYIKAVENLLPNW